MTPEDLAASIQSQDLELRVRYGFGAECVRMHPDDAKLLDGSPPWAWRSG
jgi:hypothetical protein